MISITLIKGDSPGEYLWRAVVSIDGKTVFDKGYSSCPQSMFGFAWRGLEEALRKEDFFATG